MTVDNGERRTQIATNADQPHAPHSTPRPIKGVRNGLRSLGIVGKCIGDRSTLLLTHWLVEALGKFRGWEHTCSELVWIRRIQPGPNQGFCSIETLTSSDTCGRNALDSNLCCGICRQCHFVQAFQPNTTRALLAPESGHANGAGFALAGAACLVTNLPASAGLLPRPPSLLVFCLSAVGTAASNESYKSALKSHNCVLERYVPDLTQLVGDTAYASGATAELLRADEGAYLTPELLCMLECVSKECMGTTSDEFIAIKSARVWSDDVMYPGLIEEVETLTRRQRSCGAALALNFGSESDICLYEINFGCALNHL